MPNQKILIVDDNTIYRMLTKAALQQEHYHLLEAAGADEALTLIAFEKPDLIITDVLMPNMDGFEFLRQIRSHPEYSSIKVIFYTGAFSEKEDILLAKEGGAFAHLLKPQEPDQLLAVVKNALSDQNIQTGQTDASYEEKHLRLLADKLTVKVEELERKNEELEKEILLRTRAEAEAIKSRNFFQILIETIPHLAWQCDAKGNILFTNNRWKKFHSLNNSEYHLEKWINYFHPDDKNQFLKVISQAFFQKSDFHLETRIWSCQKDAFVPFLISGIVLPSADSSDITWLATCTDISIQKRYEQQLKQLRDESEKLSKAKSEFLNNISHEMKTPLTAISGFCQLLIKELGDNKNTSFLNRILSNSLRLNTILDDIISVSEIEAKGPAELTESFSLKQFNDELVALTKQMAQEKNLEVLLKENFNNNPVLRSFPKILKQILSHLLENAVKFTPPQGEIEIRSQVHSTNDSQTYQLIYDVKDTGIGIPNHLKERLFQPFESGDFSNKKQYRGLGLGLPLSKKLANSIKGDVSLVEERSGSGSTFRVSTIATCEESD